MAAPTPENGQSSLRNEVGCIAEIAVFLKGGVPGAARLRDILPSLFSYFGIVTNNCKAGVLVKCGLAPVRTKTDISFFFAGNDVSDQFRAPKGFQKYELDEGSQDVEVAPSAPECQDMEVAPSAPECQDVEVAPSAPESVSGGEVTLSLC